MDFSKAVGTMISATFRSHSIPLGQAAPSLPLLPPHTALHLPTHLLTHTSSPPAPQRHALHNGEQSGLGNDGHL